MSAERTKNMAILVDGPEPTYGSGTGLWGGAEMACQVVDISGLDSLEPESIEDDALRLDEGENPRIQGLTSGGKVTLTTHAQGLGHLAGSADGAMGAPDGETATPNPTAHLLASALQSAPQYLTGDTVAASPAPSATVFACTTGGLALGGTDSRKIGILGVTIGARVYWRAFTYVAATKTVTLKMALPSAPAAGAVLYGTATIRYEKTWRGESIGYSAQAKIFATEPDDQNGDLDNLISGLVSGLSIPEASPKEVPKLVFEALISAATRGSFGLGTTAIPKTARAVGAGGELKLAKYGSTVGVDYYGRCSIATKPPATEIESYADQSGVGARARAAEPVSAELLTLHNVTPPTGITRTTFASCLEGGEYDEDNGGEDAVHMHLLFVLCGLPGRTIIVYLPRLVLSTVQLKQEMSGVHAQRLKLIAATEDRDVVTHPEYLFESPIIIGQG